MNSIIWRGVSSTLINGLIISELPPITKPEMRIKQTSIDGMDGSIIEELGYAPYQKNILIGLHGNFDINKVIKYFTGEGDIVFSNEPDKVYKAKICGKIDYTRLLRYRQANISFIVQPYKYKLNEYLRETPTETVSGNAISIVDSYKITSFKTYGYTKQNGIPTPTEPISISVAVGNITIKTTDGRNLESTVTYSLNGDFLAKEDYVENGVLFKNTKKIVLTGVEEIVLETNAEYTRFIISGVPDVKNIRQRLPIISTHFYFSKDESEVGVGFVFGGKLYLYPPTNVSSVDAFREWLSLNKPEVYYPIENTEKVSIGEKPQTFIPNTNIINENELAMEVTYFKPFEVFNEGLESSKPLMILKGSGTVEISVDGVAIFTYTFPDGENEVYIDSEIEDAYLGSVLKNRNMNGEFPVLIPKTNIIEWSGDIESISILPRSRWL